MVGETGRGLLFVRHAKSAWPEGVPDRNRPLAGRGERDARRVGRFLGAHDLRPDAAVASPARRAADTARLVLRSAGADVAVRLDEGLYGGDARAVVDAALADATRLLVVGHEPELVELVAQLCGADVRLPTAALAWLQLGEAGAPTARLQLLVPPRLLAEQA